MQGSVTLLLQCPLVEFFERRNVGEVPHVAQRQNSRRMAHACASVIGRLHYYTYWTYPTHGKALRHSHPPLVAAPPVGVQLQRLGQHRRARSLSSGASCRPHEAPEGACKGHGRWLSVASQPSTFAATPTSAASRQLPRAAGRKLVTCSGGEGAGARFSSDRANRYLVNVVKFARGRSSARRALQF